MKIVNMMGFYSTIKDLLRDDRVQELEAYSQHMETTRLQHSLNVAYYSYVICKKLNLDYHAAARAGLLHDFFCYDWREEDHAATAHASIHPKMALQNAQNMTALTPMEEDAIVHHMWPLTFHRPSSAEGMVVCLADKYSACVEVAVQLGQKMKSRLHPIKRLARVKASFTHSAL